MKLGMTPNDNILTVHTRNVLTWVVLWRARAKQNKWVTHSGEKATLGWLYNTLLDGTLVIQKQLFFPPNQNQHVFPLVCFDLDHKHTSFLRNNSKSTTQASLLPTVFKQTRKMHSPDPCLRPLWTAMSLLYAEGLEGKAAGFGLLKFT